MDRASSSATAIAASGPPASRKIGERTQRRAILIENHATIAPATFAIARETTSANEATRNKPAAMASG
jgi:hypothetical protein